MRQTAGFSWTRFTRCQALSLCVAVTLLARPFAQAQEEAPTEYQVKAAYLYNFAKFIEWPTNAFATTNAPMVIGVLGEDPFGKGINQLIADKTINGRPIEVRRLHDASQAKGCHIVFVSRSEGRRMQEVVKAINKEGALTVGEHDQFLRSGGVINFVLEGGKVRFEISEQAAREAGLKISSQLLKLGKKNN